MQSEDKGDGMSVLEGGWMPPLVVVTAALWAVVAAVMFWRML